MVLHACTLASKGNTSTALRQGFSAGETLAAISFCPTGKASPVGAADTAYPIAEAIAEKVAFMSGASVFADGSGHNTFRLNFSNAMPGHIEAGMRRLGGMLSHRA
jgi:hypothetical protein